MNDIVKNIYVAGHNGMVGSAVLERLRTTKKTNLIFANKSELDLTEKSQVREFFLDNKIDQIYVCAAKVGGINANNSYPVEFLHRNLMIQLNLLEQAKEAKVEKLLFLGSSCIYPKFSNQPIKEEYLLTGSLEETNESYALAKIAGIKLCESYNRQYGCDFRSVMPTNLYGPGDNYDPLNSHVIPGLLRRFHDAKTNEIDSVEVWGSGSALREFLHVYDMAEACITIMELSKEEIHNLVPLRQSHINIGSGMEISIIELAHLIKKVVNYQGYIEFNQDKPDGTKRKLLDSSLIGSLGWKPRISLEEGLISTYEEYKKSINA